MIDLGVEFEGIRFKNPIIVSSAEPTDNLPKMRKAVENGAGGLVVKTLTDSEAMRKLSHISRWHILDERHEKCQGKIPRLFTFYGRSGLSKLSVEEWVAMVKEARAYAEEHHCVLVGSVGTTAVKNWVELCRLQEDLGLKAIELNFGCPHPSEMEGTKTGMLIGQDLDLMVEILRAVTDAVTVPVIAKLTPQVADLVEVSRAAKEARAAAVTLTNRFVGFAVDIETGRPFLDSWAGVGGPWVLPLTLRWVSKVYLNVDIPIWGSNGVYDWRDIVQFLMSGATLVQTCSAIMVQGWKTLPAMIGGLEEFMERKGYHTIGEMRGIAAKSSIPYAALHDLPKHVATINHEICTECQRCIWTCWWDALVYHGDERTHKMEVIEENCMGCTICTCVCPIPGAITMTINPHA